MKKKPEFKASGSGSSQSNTSLNISLTGDNVNSILDDRYELLEGLGNVRTTKVYLV